MSFGEQLQFLRRGSGLTQEQFAEQLHVSRQAVSKWESGKGYPEMDKLLFICRQYHVTLNDLFEQGECPPISRENAPAGSLRSSVSALINNLSPRNKWLAAGILLGVAVLAGLMGLCLKGGETDMVTAIWIAAMVVFGIVEAATAGLTSIWFVLGSAAGLITAICGGTVWLQVTLFFVVSIVALLATRPLVRKMMDKKITPTNADGVLGKEARVTETIDNTEPSGAVYVEGKTWSARSESGEILQEDTMVRIVRMEGVKLFVERL